MNARKWEVYERIAAQLFDKFADKFGWESVEGKQKVRCKSGVDCEIDAKAMLKEDEGFWIIECKHWKGSVSQDNVRSLAHRRKDIIGAKGAILVSYMPPQKGAKTIAEYEGIKCFYLDKNATLLEYVLSAEGDDGSGKLFVGMADKADPGDELVSGVLNATDETLEETGTE